MTERRCDVTLQKLSVDWTREILYSLRVCMVRVLQSRTRFLCSKAVLEYSEEEPALQCRRQSANRTRRHRNTGSWATEGVLDYGVLGCPGYVTWARLMGHEDTR